MDGLEVTISLLVSAAAPRVLEALKARRWAVFIHRHAPVLNRVTALAVSVATALGVGWSFDAAVGTLTITGLVPADVVRLGLQAVGNLVVQEAVYRTTIDPKRR